MQPRDTEILRRAQQGESYDSIAESVGISKARVHQILANTGYQRRNIPRPCQVCGALKVMPPGRKYCSRLCYGRSRRTVAYQPCAFCGVEVRKRPRAASGLIFCCRSHSALYQWRKLKHGMHAVQQTATPDTSLVTPRALL